MHIDQETKLFLKNRINNNDNSKNSETNNNNNSQSSDNYRDINNKNYKI